MGFAVSDEDRPVVVDENSVGTGEVAFLRGAVRTIPALSGACDQLDQTPSRVDHPDAVTLGIGQKNLSPRSDAETFGSRQRRLLRRTSIARESLVAGPGCMTDHPADHVDLVDRVSFTQREPEVSFAVEIERARAEERSPVECGAIGCSSLLAGAGEGGNRSRFCVYLPDAMVADVTDV